MKYLTAFTLTELLITLAIISIIIGLGVPSFIQMIEKNELSAETIRLHKALALARSSAVMRETYVTVCPLSGDQCKHDWNEEISVFVDINEDRVKDEEDESLFLIQAVTNEKLSRTKTRDRAITFDPYGSAFGFNTTFSLCMAGKQTYGRSLIISNTGRIRRGSDKNEDEIDEDSGGSNIDCGT